MWEYVARKVQKEYGAYVDWDERFYTCPECGEPIYEADQEDADFMYPEDIVICPVCEFWY